MAGLDPAIPIDRHGRAPLIGIAGSSPAMTPLVCAVGETFSKGTVIARLDRAIQ